MSIDAIANFPWFRGEKLGQRLFRTRAKDTLPHVITHDRVYILPSRKGWAYVVSLMIMLVASINYSLNLGYALCFMMTGLFCSTLLATYKNLNGLIVTGITSGDGIVGKPVMFRFSFRNEAAERFAIDVGDRDNVIRCDIPIHEEVDAVYRLIATRRGWLPLGRITISSGYPLGLWVAWSYLHTNHKCLVFPASENQAPSLPATTHTEQSGSNKSNNADFDGMREYRPGDPINTIAWKSSARGTGLYVRESTGQHSVADQHLLWQQTSSLGDIEQRLSRLAAWIDQAETSNTRFSLSLPGQFIGTDAGTHHAHAAKTLLALHGSEIDEAQTD